MKARSAIKRRSLEEVKEALKRRPIISRIFWVARLWLAAAQWKTGRIWTAYERRRGTDNRDWRNGSYSSVLSSCSARRGAVAPTATILYPSVTLVGRSAAATSHTKSARLRSRFHSWNRRLAGELSRAKLRAAGKKRAHRISRRGAREKGQEESERRRRKGGIDPIKRPRRSHRRRRRRTRRNADRPIAGGTYVQPRALFKGRRASVASRALRKVPPLGGSQLSCSAYPLHLRQSAGGRALGCISWYAERCYGASGGNPARVTGEGRHRSAGADSRNSALARSLGR